MSVRVPGWSGRTQVERVRLYTVGSLYFLYWTLLALGWLGAAADAATREPRDGIALGVVLAVPLVLGSLTLRESVRLYPERAPVPTRLLGGLLVTSIAAAGAIEVLVEEEEQFGALLIVLAALCWGAGGLRDRRALWTIGTTTVALALAVTGEVTAAAGGLVAGLFFVFTVQSSLWLLDVVTQLDQARGTQAALAVAEERLRFSRDVHDVLGRRLSTIAVQAELAGTLARTGDPRTAGSIDEVRTSAHEALREARQLARGYRPLDLDTEVVGAISLLRSAGIEAEADLAGLPLPWHEPVARVIREAVTNVIRHSRAVHVSMAYDGQAVTIRNDGVADGPGTGDCSGLRSLADDLAPLGARLTSDCDGEDFVVRLDLAAEKEAPA